MNLLQLGERAKNFYGSECWEALTLYGDRTEDWSSYDAMIYKQASRAQSYDRRWSSIGVNILERPQLKKEMTERVNALANLCFSRISLTDSLEAIRMQGSAFYAEHADSLRELALIECSLAGIAINSDTNTEVNV